MALFHDFTMAIFLLQKCATVTFIVLYAQIQTNKIFESVTKQHFQKFYCGSLER
jgi:hypothetical protein